MNTIAQTFTNRSRRVLVTTRVARSHLNALETIKDDDDFKCESAKKLAGILLDRDAVTEASAVSRSYLMGKFFGPTYSRTVNRLTIASTPATPTAVRRLEIIDLHKKLIDMQMKVRGAVVHLSKELKSHGCFMRCFRRNRTEPMYCVAMCPTSVSRSMTKNNVTLAQARRNKRILQNLQDIV